MAVIELNKDNFDKEVKEHKGVVLVDFYGTWCHPCMILKPIYKELSEQIDGVKFASLDTDKAPEISQEHGIRGIPCIIAFKNGQEIDRIVGLMPKDQLKQAIEEIKRR